MKLTIRPVTPDLWLALEDLFGKWGASNGCWCMYWRLGGAYRGRREENKERLRSRPPLQGVFFCDIWWKGLFSIPGRKVQSLQTNTGFECTEVAPNFAQ
jgi:hypothetical protein